MSTLKSSSPTKNPKTARGQRTRSKLLEAAEGAFGEEGFHTTSISDITRRASVALGTFYVYFDSKDEVFRALVQHMGEQARTWISERVTGATDRLDAEHKGLVAFIEFARAHKNLYRIIMESQFVAPDAYRDYYENFAESYQRNLDDAVGRGELSKGDSEIRAWSLIGMSVFLGLRYGVWDETRPVEDIARDAIDLISNGLRP